MYKLKWNNWFHVKNIRKLLWRLFNKKLKYIKLNNYILKNSK